MPHIFGSGRSQRALSAQAREILDAAKNRGEVFLLRGSGTGKWVASGSRHFFYPRNPSVTAAYLEGLRELESKGLVRHDSGNHYRVTVRHPELGKWLK